MQGETSPFRLHTRGATAAVRLTPGGRTDALQGLAEMAGGGVALKISVNAPPEDGRANKALLAFLAESWGVPRGSLSLLSGASNRQKVVLAEGDGAALLQKMESWLSAARR